MIVVDDASTDRTAAVAEEHGARVVQVAHRQIAATRYSGAREAKGEFLIFVDADTVVNAAVVRAALQAIRNGGIGGGCDLRFDGRLPFWGRLLILSFRPLYRVARVASGCFLFCTWRVFEAAGGFDEALYAAEEAAMSRALKRQGRFVVLRETVLTSGRKLRAHSLWEVLRVLGRLAVIGVGLFISSLAKTQQQAILGVFAFMVPAILLSGFASPVENMPDWLQWVTLANPIRYFIVIVKGIFLKNLPASIIVANIWPMVVIGTITLSSSAWLFRRRAE
jgi:glycosyltransferase involved in cell wall biosynthesis